jgi:hypothetical protein
MASKFVFAISNQPACFLVSSFCSGDSAWCAISPAYAKKLLHASARSAAGNVNQRAD